MVAGESGMLLIMKENSKASGAKSAPGLQGLRHVARHM